EEANRRLTGVLTNYHFAPTETSKENLLRENFALEDIFVTGNTVIDALLMVKDKIESDSDLSATLASQFPFLDESKKLILV
ncbi:UDP-N-acetylglucosamine 2-epimerase, partial [Escherichia coli]|nr:UDP-N-acetylglucosamine 2-epimerase [Escherichia coli]